jgi:hypothetical protein
MPFDTSQYLALRPYAYHVTASENLSTLRSHRRIQSAAELLRLANRLDLLRERRRSYVPLCIGNQTVLLKDQHPLVEANTALADGWEFGDFVEYLNRHVFFWPGTGERVIGPVRRLMEHYASDGPALLRVPTRQLFDSNPAVLPLYCAFNSGAPRYNDGHRMPRGPDLFASAGVFPRRASEVVELGFRDEITLPMETEFLTAGDWKRVFRDG